MRIVVGRAWFALCAALLVSALLTGLIAALALLVGTLLARTISAFLRLISAFVGLVTFAWLIAFTGFVGLARLISLPGLISFTGLIGAFAGLVSLAWLIAPGNGTAQFAVRTGAECRAVNTWTQGASAGAEAASTFTSLGVRTIPVCTLIAFGELFPPAFVFNTHRNCF